MQTFNLYFDTGTRYFGGITIDGLVSTALLEADSLLYLMCKNQDGLDILAQLGSASMDAEFGVKAISAPQVTSYFKASENIGELNTIAGASVFLYEKAETAAALFTAPANCAFISNASAGSTACMDLCASKISMDSLLHGSAEMLLHSIAGLYNATYARADSGIALCVDGKLSFIDNASAPAQLCEISTKNAEIILNRLSFVSDWSNRYMSDLKDMTLSTMAYTEVV